MIYFFSNPFISFIESIIITDSKIINIFCYLIKKYNLSYFTKKRTVHGTKTNLDISIEELKNTILSRCLNYHFVYAGNN